MTPEKLIGEVSRQVSEKQPGTYEEWFTLIVGLTLEQAAQEAHGHGADDDDPDDYLNGYNAAVVNITASIRALIKRPA